VGSVERRTKDSFDMRFHAREGGNRIRELALDQPHEQGVQGTSRRKDLLHDGVERLARPDHLCDGGRLAGGAKGVGEDGHIGSRP
jgi:hypothetical protein